MFGYLMTGPTAFRDLAAMSQAERLDLAWQAANDPEWHGRGELILSVLRIILFEHRLPGLLAGLVATPVEDSV